MSATTQNANQPNGHNAPGDVIHHGVNRYPPGESPVVRSWSTGRNADGTRISKGTITSWSCDPTLSGFTTTSDYILGPSGEQLIETGASTTNGVTSMQPQHINVWAGGQLLGTYDGNGGGTGANLHLYLDDPLGTRRVQTDIYGVVEQTCFSLPFGDAESCATTPTEHLFTGKERDQESGNDYFGARYYASAMGRFLSPDWSANPQAIPYADFTRPQTLNLYGYMRNNPLSGVDKDGHCDPLCGWLIDAVSTKVGTYLAQHPAVAKAIEKVADSAGIKLQLSATAKYKNPAIGADVGGAVSLTSEGRNDGSGSSAVQGTLAAQAGGGGGELNGTATFEKNGDLVNPINNLSGSAEGRLSGKLNDEVNGAATLGTDGTASAGIGLPLIGGKVDTPLGTGEVSVQAGLQVTADAGAVKDAAGEVVNAAVQDTKQYVQDLHESTTCGAGGCAGPH